MIIKRGSALKEDAKAVITETRFTKRNLNNDKLLLVEGPDDIDVIRNYYLYRGREVSRVFRVIKANEEDIEGSSKTAGKQNALNMFERLKQEQRNVICLLDRDYDFYLKEKVADSRVKYYHYYELENYLFDDSVLRIILKNVCNYPDIEYYQKIVLLLHEIEQACKPYVLLCFLREVNYRKNILTEDQLTMVLKIINVKLTSMMEMKNLGVENPLDRITSYIETELAKVSLSTVLIQKMIDENDYESSVLMNEKNPLSLFRYALKGKTLSNFLSHFFNYILNNNPFLNEFKSKGNLSSIPSRLKIEWIPNSSKNFEELLNTIERDFETAEALKK